MLLFLSLLFFKVYSYTVSILLEVNAVWDLDLSFYHMGPRDQIRRPGPVVGDFIQ